MIIYNVTVKVATAEAAEWLNWMKNEHLPDVMSTGLFTGYQLMRLLEQDDSEGFTYAVHLSCRTLSDYDLYVRDHAPRLRMEHHRRFPRNVAFRSVLELI